MLHLRLVARPIGPGSELTRDVPSCSLQAGSRGCAVSCLKSLWLTTYMVGEKNSCVPKTDEQSPRKTHISPIEAKQVRSKLSTGRLLRAATELIAERGYERTTLAAVGERAGYSHGLVTRRFGSKDGLLAALLQKMITEWHEHEIAPFLREANGFAAIRVVIDGIRTSVRRDPGAMRALYTLMFEALKPEPALLNQRMSEIHRAQRRSLVDAVRRGIDAGSVRTATDPEAVARMVVATLRGTAYQWLLEPGFEFDSTLAAFEEHMEEALRPHPFAVPSC